MGEGRILLCRWKWNHSNIMPLCQNLKEEGGATESNDWSHVRIFWCQVQAERAQIHSIAPGVDSQRPLGLVVLQLHLLKSSQSDTRVCFLMAWCFWCACEKMQKCTWVSTCARKSNLHVVFRLCHLVVICLRTLSSLLFPHLLVLWTITQGLTALVSSRHSTED